MEAAADAQTVMLHWQVARPTECPFRSLPSLHQQPKSTNYYAMQPQGRSVAGLFGLTLTFVLPCYPLTSLLPRILEISWRAGSGQRFNPWFNPNGALWKMAISLPSLTIQFCCGRWAERERALSMVSIKVNLFPVTWKGREVRC